MYGSMYSTGTNNLPLYEPVSDEEIPSNRTIVNQDNEPEQEPLPVNPKSSSGK